MMISKSAITEDVEFLCNLDDCDGETHFTATWDEETGRWHPVNYRCPLRDHRRDVA